MMEAERSFPCVEQMDSVGLLTNIIPELEPCRLCAQNDFHEWDVFEHTIRTYEKVEMILTNPAVLWPEFAEPVNAYLEKGNHIVLLKLAAFDHAHQHSQR